VTGDHPDRDDLVAYALGAADSKERRAIEAHAPGCARCTRELEALTPAIAVLGESVEQLKPPAELRERVMAEVHTDVAREREELERGATAPRRPSRRGWHGVLSRPALAVGLAIVIAAVGGYVIAGDGGGGSSPDQQTDPVVAQQGISGTLAVGELSSMLDLRGLPQPKGREVYQVWVAKGEKVRPSSNFIPDVNGMATTAVDGHLTSGTQVMVTREPAPGSTTPTRPILLTAAVQ
jgi:anti-sigma-K factor RskA